MRQGKLLAVLIAGILLSPTVAAGQTVTPVKYKTVANLWAARMDSLTSCNGTETTASATLFPVEVEGKHAYFVNWWWQKAILGVGGHRQHVTGIAPATSVQPSGSNGLSVDLDLNQLLVVFEAVDIQCTPDAPGPPCVVSTVTSVPFKGRFEPDNISFSSTTSRSTGSYRIVYLAQGITSAKMTFNLTGAGEQIGQSANFIGTVGPIVVPLLVLGRGNTEMDLRSGSGTLELQPAQ